MNGHAWDIELQWNETTQPSEELGNEEIYTLHVADFFTIPDIDYNELSKFDPHIRVLFN